MSEKTTTWSTLLNFLKNLFLVIFTLGRRGSLSNNSAGMKTSAPENKTPKEHDVTPKSAEPSSSPGGGDEETMESTKTETPNDTSWTKDQLLSPILHRRYISIYCIADLEDGDVPIHTTRGAEIWKISEHSRSRLDMEGTGRLSNGKVVNVAKVVDGAWTYKVMGPQSPNGVGIRSKALVPWVSLAHHLQQLRTHSLFGRTVIIPSLVGFTTPDSRELDGKFEVHDTGGGLRKCPFERGLWRTGATKSEYGQFDLFMGGPESAYKELLGSWNSYREVIVMPRDTETPKGIQETLNLLLDAGLKIDGIIGPKSKEAIEQLQDKAGLEETGEWDSLTQKYAESSLNNW